MRELRMSDPEYRAKTVVLDGGEPAEVVQAKVIVNDLLLAKPLRFVCIEPWNSLPASVDDPQEWEQRAAAACLAPGGEWSTTLSTTFER